MNAKTGAKAPAAKVQRNLFRWRKIGAKHVVTNDHGAHTFLDDEQLDELITGRVKAGTPLYEEMRQKGFLLEDTDIQRVADAYDRKVSFVYRGPVLHILVVTLRCNEVCTYCHASRSNMSETETDMSITTAEKCVDMALRSPSNTMTIEFQGGEPLANYEVVQHVVEYGSAQAQARGKRVMFSLVSNLALMDETKLDWLVQNRVQISTSLDGPKDLHDRNRKLVGGSAYDRTVFWMKRINEAYVAAGLDPQLYHVEALATITREHLSRAKDLVDEYVKNECRAIFLRPLNPFGFAKKTGEKVSYTATEFLTFYNEALDYVLQKNRDGVEILERLGAIFLSKIMTPDDPNYLDIRSPCGAGIGQIAYNHDGSIFTCDEGRMVYQMGDEVFRIGSVDTLTLKDVVTSETVKSMAMASCLDGLPGCAACAYKPFCGTCPVFNYTEQGNIFPQNSTNSRCTIYMGIQDRLFRELQSEDPTVRGIFQRWITVKDRPEFMHDGRHLGPS